MSLQNDPVYQYIVLDGLRRKLMYIKYEWLELQCLQPLKDEVERRIKELQEVHSETV